MLLSKEVFGSGGHPIFNSGEHSCLHGNVMGIYRLAFGERFGIEEDCINLTDTEVLQCYEVRAPYATVRFMRLRLSVRMVLKAPSQLLALMVAARHDGRSWLRALEGDLEWMKTCDPKATFTPLQWFKFCRKAPKAARNTVRKVCDSSAARSRTVLEQKSSVRNLQNSVT